MSTHVDVPMLTLPVSDKRDHVRGPSTAAVTLLEYGDFECSHCGTAYPIVEEILAEFGDQLRMAYRNFPLTQVHPHAERAAQAAECAGAQGQFWEMHHMLFENQDALDDQSLVEYAAALGLDVPEFERELLAGQFAPRVREDFLSGVRSGVNGTPTFFINEHRHNGPWDLESLSAAIIAASPHGSSRRRGGGRP